MRCPMISTLLKQFPALTREDANKIRKLAKLADDREGLADYIETHCPATHQYARSCFSDPYDSYRWRVVMALHAIDRALGTYGVEPIGERYEYCNTGDSYAATLIYKRDTDNLFVGSWADYAG